MVDEVKLREAVKKAKTYTEVVDKLGLSRSSGNYRTVKNYIKQFGIDVSHMLGQAWSRGLNKSKDSKKKSLESLLRVGTVTYSSFKDRLIEAGYFERRCCECGGYEWRGSPMPTNLHHINGDRFDNRIDNLKILCPNCHALTPNYGSKNSANHILSKYTYDEFKELAEKHSVKELSVITQLGRGSVKAILKHYGLKTHSCSFGSVVEARRKFNPTKEDLEKAVWSLPTTKVARFYGVSDTAVAKRCRLFGIKKPPRGYWSSSLQHGGRSSIG